MSCYVPRPWMGQFFHPHPHTQLLVWTVCGSGLCQPLRWAPAVDTALLVHIPHASSPRNQPQVLLILLKSKQVSVPSYAMTVCAWFLMFVFREEKLTQWWASGSGTNWMEPGAWGHKSKITHCVVTLVINTFLQQKKKDIWEPGMFLSRVRFMY